MVSSGYVTAPTCRRGARAAGPPQCLQSRMMVLKDRLTERGRSSGVEHNLAKVGVEGSNPFARSKFFIGKSERYDRVAARRPFAFGAYIF